MINAPNAIVLIIARTNLMEIFTVNAFANKAITIIIKINFANNALNIGNNYLL